MNPYNGYSGDERLAKLRAQHDREKQGLPRHPPGPCSICNDPNAPLEPHSEDYSKPYLWTPPAEYALCKMCHVHRLHARFRNPVLWEVYKAHVRRGGYSSDLKNPAVAAELAAFRAALQRKEYPRLRMLRPREFDGKEWWEKLSTDTQYLEDRATRLWP